MSTISNERLDSIERQFIEDGFNDITDSEVAKLVSEVRALRKERELAVPVGYRKLFTCSSCGAEGLDEPLESRCHCNGDGARWIEGRLYTSPPAPGADDDSLPYDPQIAEYEQMMEAEQSEAATDNTSQQFESLAGKAVVPEGWKLVPVEPSPKMLVALWEHRDSMRGVSENKIASVGYKAMLAVAPEPCK
ncbi:hypothetical protein ACMSW1_002524 [Cronobacter dublinensis]